MLGEILLTTLALAASSSDNDTNNMTTRQQSQNQLDAEKERTKQEIIKGVFGFLSACANASSNDDQ